MKLVYAVDKLSYNSEDHVGVIKKVESQIAQFERNGIEVELCQYVWQGGYPQIRIESDTDILYFRRIEPSIKLILKLCELKKINPKLCMIMEIPTYPFESEELEKVSFKKKINRILGSKLLKVYVNRIVLTGQQYPIAILYGIPTICINNGVDFQKLAIRNVKEVDISKKEIHMICVSGCFFWHGYDRLIEGMHQYYEHSVNQEAVFFHIVGAGECLERYKEMAQKYGLLNNKIFFYGRKVGEELDAIYDKCDIAIDCLGCHRKNIYYVSTLKSKEYGAKGLPIISSVQLDIYNEETKRYIKMFPATDEAIDIQNIVDYYHVVYDNNQKKEVAEEVREVFYFLCDWKFAFSPIIDYIKMVIE